MKQYVIIGNGVAAAGCVEGIRSVDKEGKIVIVSKEKYPVYCRPLISYYLEGKTGLDRINYRPDDFYNVNNCGVLYGKTAEKIDHKEKQVVLSDNKAIPYTALCVAAGSSPIALPFEGISTVSRKFNFTTLDDALELEKTVNGESRVLIIGAGLIGLKCAEGLHKRVKSITVCDMADKVLPSILDAETAPTVQRHIENSGIVFMLSDSVKRFEGGTAVMNSGKTVEFDVLVTAVGVRPNTSLIAESGGAIGRGITVDSKMQTSIEGIYAAGDCTEGYDISYGANRVLALLPNAYMQGYTAGVNMAGGERVFDKAIAMNSIGFFGLHIMTAGCCDIKDNQTVYRHNQGGNIKKFFVGGGVLKGFILIGDVNRGGIYTSLIREKVPLNTVDFDLMRISPGLAAFSFDSRKKIMGGRV